MNETELSKTKTVWKDSHELMEILESGKRTGWIILEFEDGQRENACIAITTYEESMIFMINHRGIKMNGSYGWVTLRDLQDHIPDLKIKKFCFLSDWQKAVEQKLNLI